MSGALLVGVVLVDFECFSFLGVGVALVSQLLEYTECLQ